VPPRRLAILLAALAALLLWRRSARHGDRLDVLYDDGSLLRLDRGVEADDLLADARELLAILT
jgi:hypothetical protein